MRRISRGRRARGGQMRAGMLAYLGVVVLLVCLLGLAVLGWMNRVV